ncbi:MAG: hypothetical protein GY931_19750, partial [Maribacter sp.]|nr:hypothetical protein [Maribacter sp.]
MCPNYNQFILHFKYLGVFVTQSQVAAFGDALLLAPRRAGATTWDVEQFERQYLQQIIDTIAARNPDQTRQSVKALMQLPPEAVAAMQKTAVSEISYMAIYKGETVAHYARFSADRVINWILFLQAICQEKLPRLEF